MSFAGAASTYASEADLLNVALFGQTAKQWRDANPTVEGNVRDSASVQQLPVLANIESLNAPTLHGVLRHRRRQRDDATLPAVRRMLRCPTAART